MAMASSFKNFQLPPDSNGIQELNVSNLSSHVAGLDGAPHAIANVP